MPEGKEYVVGGIVCNVYGLGDLARTPATQGLAVLFLLHGRLEHQKGRQLLKGIDRLLAASSEAVAQGGKALLVVTFDHRNHGSRQVQPLRNMGWKDTFPGLAPELRGKDGELTNESHVGDMYSVQLGGSRDVSFLIDTLEGVLFPTDERTVEEWYISGVSLGGHTTYLCLAHEPRLTLGVPIIASPDCLTLLTHRAANLPLDLRELVPTPLAPPILPGSLKRLIEKQDPVNVPKENWKGKKMLVLSGEDDQLVNFVNGGGEAFVDRLRKEKQVGSVEVVVEKGCGHKFSNDMIEHLAVFVGDQGLLSGRGKGGKARI